QPDTDLRDDLLQQIQTLQLEKKEWERERKGMYTADELQERVEEACIEVEKEWELKLAQLQKQKNQKEEEESEYVTAHTSYSNPSPQQMQDLQSLLHKEMESSTTLKQKYQSLHSRTETALGDYTSLLLRHEDLQRRYREMEKAYFILKAGYEKEKMGHERLKGVLRKELGMGDVKADLDEVDGFEGGVLGAVVKRVNESL
ncbi:hypothetical protein HDV05_002372, partial [Chytridiales sp. JEL 0842]